MTPVLLFAFVALCLVAAAIALLAWRSWQRRRQGIDGPPSAVPSDWAEVTQRYRTSRIEALRDWMGEDHELVRELPAQGSRGTAPPQSDPGPAQRRRVGPMHPHPTR